MLFFPMHPQQSLKTGGGPMKQIFQFTKQIGLVMLFVIACDQQKDEPVSFQNQFNAIIQTIEQKRADIEKIEIETAQLIQAFNEQFPNKEQFVLADLFDGTTEYERRNWLAARIQNEEDPSYSALIDEIVRFEKLHHLLTEKINQLQDRGGFSAPIEVQWGDSHQSLAKNFLAGWDDNIRKNMIEKTALWDYIEPGNHVYFATRGNTLFTCVVQGKAKQSPNQARRRTQKKASQKLARLTSETDSLRNQNITLETTSKILQAKVDFLDDKTDNLQSIIEMQYAKLADMERANHSVHYIIGKKIDLLTNGTLHQSWVFFSEIDSFDTEMANSLDLRNATAIHIRRNLIDEPLKKIKLLPAEFEKGIDYSVSIQDTHATVKILRPEQFKHENIVIITN